MSILSAERVHLLLHQNNLNDGSVSVHSIVFDYDFKGFNIMAKQCSLVIQQYKIQFVPQPITWAVEVSSQSTL